MKSLFALMLFAFPAYAETAKVKASITTVALNNMIVVKDNGTINGDQKGVFLIINSESVTYQEYLKYKETVK